MSETTRLAAALAGRYAIERELGAGGMATVYLARDLKHSRDVALKVLRPELAAVLGAERFLQEVRVRAVLDHPHILTLIDAGESEGFVWYVLPYVRGESLRKKLTREQQLSIEETVRITTQVASALDYAHRHGVIHRDIKPENILLHEGEAVVADFGIALAVPEAGGPPPPQTPPPLGTPPAKNPGPAAAGPGPAAGIVGALARGAGIWRGVRAAARRGGPAFVALDRSQLTFTGNATSPAISGDGKQVAYVVKRCTGATCSYGIEIQDVGGGESRRVIDGATALYSIRWSPDRRFLIFGGTIASRFGDYIVSTLHGTPRYLGIVMATFFPDGDSLLVAPFQNHESTVWVWIPTLDGDHRDSIRIEDVNLPAVVPVASGRWMVVQSSRP